MKAAKALLVIIPLLGITQVMFIYGPKADHSKEEQRNSIIIFQIIHNQVKKNQFEHFFKNPKTQSAENRFLMRR